MWNKIKWSSKSNGWQVDQVFIPYEDICNSHVFNWCICRKFMHTLCFTYQYLQNNNMKCRSCQIIDIDKVDKCGILRRYLKN